MKIIRTLSYDAGFSFRTKKEFFKEYFDFNVNNFQQQLALFPYRNEEFVLDTPIGEHKTWVVWCFNEDNSAGNGGNPRYMNQIIDDGEYIYEYPQTSDNYLGKIDPERTAVRLVFMKARTAHSPHIFFGIYVADADKCTKEHNVYKRISRTVDLIGNPVKHIHIDGIIDKSNIVVPDIDIVEEAQFVSEVNAAIIDENYDFTYVPEPQPAPMPTEKNKSKQYKRDPKQAAIALYRANYTCECNMEHVSFIRKSNGKNYTEPHHLIPMAQQALFKNSIDVPANIVSLCSNCHNCIHYGRERNVLLKILYDERVDELRKAGIFLEFETLVAMYD